MQTQTNNPNNISPFSLWEEAVTDHLAAHFECTYSDAAGLVEAQDFLMRQSWGLGLTAEQTAAKIIAL